MKLSSPVVIFGAGSLGRRVAQAVSPILFCDNNPALWGTICENVPVESPETAIERYPGATFIAAIWHPSRTETMSDRVIRLKSIGASNVIPFSALFAEYGNFLLPHWFWERPDYYAEHADEIRSVRALMDPAGQQEFDRQMQLRLGNVSNQVIDSGTQYFPQDVFELSPNEVFIDCGAYDGDTIGEFRRASGDQFARIIAFEPDPKNFAALESALSGDPRIMLQPYATGIQHGTVRFTLSGTASRISSSGACEVKVTTLDEALEGIAPTYMKFDIEGSEPDALKGGRKTITQFRPKVAACLYHAPDHLWTIPLLLNELLPNSQFTMRTYIADGWECVCYCIPN
ncbi:MAG TPA: FkbM family methyltransferase [Candidatus Sulfotelmatobacter sp.]|jgi:FkbM family methyltransferase|nr:FkbM family methyltransferase [Candidatus Sulfotelmatobacter sp.]